MPDLTDNASNNPPTEKKSWLQRLTGRKSAEPVEVVPAPAPPPAGIAQEILTDITLCQLNGELPDNTKFTKLAALKNVDKGARAFLYQNKEDRSDIRLVFPGRSAGIRGTSTRVENSTTAAVTRGRTSYQLEVVNQWMQETVLPTLKLNGINKVKIFGHSLGSGNAIMAKHLLDKSSICSETKILEPFAATLAARHILEEDLKVAASDEEKAAAVKRLQKDVTSIRSFPNTAEARNPVGTSISNNKSFGDQAYFLTATPEKPAQEGMSRRDVLALPSKVISVPRRIFKDGTLENDDFNQAGHRLQSCKKVLEALGDKAIQPAAATVLSTVDQILHPELYPVPKGSSVLQEFEVGLLKGASK